MQLYCQSCQAAFASASHCPRCGSRLLSPQESFIHAGKGRKPPPDPVVTTFANRLAVGTVIALGLAIGVHELAEAVSILFEDANDDPNTFAIRLFAVLGGGLVAGAGRRHGLQVGTATGLLAAVLFTAFDLYAGTTQKFTAIFLAAIYPLMAGVAGTVGAWLWPADADLPEPARLSSHGSSLAKLAAEDSERRIARPTAWLQIAFGAIVVAIGIIASDPIRLALAKASGGWFNTGGAARSAIIGLEIGTLCTLLGGILAGAGTGAGLKHGFFASILAAVMLLIVSGNQPGGIYPAVQGYLNLFGLEHEPFTTPRIAINFLLGLITLMCVAGALGGQLFPPLAPKKLRNRTMRRQA